MSISTVCSGPYKAASFIALSICLCFIVYHRFGVQHASYLRVFQSQNLVHNSGSANIVTTLESTSSSQYITTPTANNPVETKKQRQKGDPVGYPDGPARYPGDPARYPGDHSGYEQSSKSTTQIIKETIKEYSKRSSGTPSPVLCSQQARQQLLKEACKKYKLQELKRRDYWRLLVDDEHHVMYCAIPKSGCTTMKTLMVQNSRKMRDNPEVRAAYNPAIVNNFKQMAKLGLRTLSSFSEEERLGRLERYKKLLVVRHPLSRLYSAYHDKIYLKNLRHPEYYYDTVDRYFSNKSKSGFLDVTFEEFLALVGFEYDTGDFRNRHWTSGYDLCHPCNIDYDYIATLETMITDQSRVLSLLKINSTKTVAKLHSKSGSSSNHLFVNIFARVTAEILKRIQKVYDADFRLFGYKSLHGGPCAKG